MTMQVAMQTFLEAQKNQTTYISLLQDFKRLLRLVGHELIHVKLVKNKF